MSDDVFSQEQVERIQRRVGGQAAQRIATALDGIDPTPSEDWEPTGGKWWVTGEHGDNDMRVIYAEDLRAVLMALGASS